MCKEFLAFQKQVAMKQTRRHDSYYVGGLSEKDAAAYVAKIKRYNIARIQTLHRVWVVRRALGYTHVSARGCEAKRTPPEQEHSSSLNRVKGCSSCTARVR
eukprot:31293-Pelagococcus_subviridis.AAC.11